MRFGSCSDCRASEEEVEKPKSQTKTGLGRRKAGDARSGRQTELMGLVTKSDWMREEVKKNLEAVPQVLKIFLLSIKLFLCRLSVLCDTFKLELCIFKESFVF